MARMMRKNYKIPGPCSCRDCTGPAIKGRTAEEREWRNEWQSEEAWADAVRRLWVPGYCPITLWECPEGCNHSGAFC